MKRLGIGPALDGQREAGDSMDVVELYSITGAILATICFVATYCVRRIGVLLETEFERVALSATLSVMVAFAWPIFLAVLVMYATAVLVFNLLFKEER